MKLGIIGYGKMGREIEKKSISRGHFIETVIDSAMDWSGDDLVNTIEVAIEFTSPNAAKNNILECIKRRIPIVVGTTGWYDDFDEIRNLCTENNSHLFHATNFSIGVNIVFTVNKFLAKLMNHQNAYEVWIKESHHLQKKDSPSGTAISMADGIISNLERKKNWSLENDYQNEASLWIQSFRLGEVPGTHEIMYNSDIDTISLKHEAKSREGFAVGAVLAAEWLIQQKPGVYGMNDLLNINI